MKNICLSFLSILILFSCKSVEKAPQKVSYKNFYKFNFEIENDLKKDTIEPDYQLAATEYALKGDQENALRVWDLGFKPKIKSLTEKEKDSVRKSFNLLSAKDFILQKSKEEKIIMLNELHHLSSHRVFAESILQGLFDNGYKVFCVEALSNGKYEDSLLNSRKYPIKDTGFYTINPQFGDLLRKALKIGYKILPYETTQEMGGEVREADQANNVKNIINKYPNDKILIYCGAGHAIEGDLDYWGGKSLAGRINELTGIDPLTIDQSFYAEKSKTNYSKPLLSLLDPKEPSVLVDNNKAPIPYIEGGGWMDIVILHPITNYIDNRPDWLLRAKENLLKIDVTDLKIKGPIMVMAFKEGEDWINGVPVDIQEVNNNEGYCYLALNKGIYTIIISNLEGQNFKLIKKVK